MNARRSKLIAIAAATATVAGASAATAVAHPGKGPAQRAEVADLRAAVAQCDISDSERDVALTDSQKERLQKIEARMDERSDAEGLTERQQRRLEWIEGRMVKRSVARAARISPVLELFDLEDRAAFRQALRDAPGLRALVRSTDGVSMADVRDARKDGRKAVREALRELCADGEGDGSEGSSS